MRAPSSPSAAACLALALGLTGGACADGGGDDDDGRIDGRQIDARSTDDAVTADATPSPDAPGAWLNESDLPAEADFCNLQFPATLELAPGAPSEPIYARLFEAGRTEAAGAPAGIVGQLGIGPDGVLPSGAGWTWVAAAYNVQVANDDEFSATITAPSTPGTYRYAARFSIDGTGFTACDLDGAGSNGGLALELAQLGTLTVTP